MKFIITLDQRKVQTFHFDCEVPPDTSYQDACDRAEEAFFCLTEDERKPLLIETKDNAASVDAAIDWSQKR